eukprot:76323_1
MSPPNNAALIWILSLTMYFVMGSNAFDYNAFSLGYYTLPRTMYAAAVGYDVSNDSIWLLGGTGSSWTRKQLVQYQVGTGLGVFVDYGSSVLQEEVYVASQGYAQLNQYLFIVDYYGDSLHRFNMNNQIMDSNYYSLPIDVGYSYYTCMCVLDIDHAYLVIIGGRYIDSNGHYLDTIQILNMSSNEWMQGISSLNTPRAYPICETFNHSIFAIAGENPDFGNPYLDTVEVYNFDTNEWNYITDRLSIPFIYGSAVVYQNEIVIFGGYAVDDYGGYWGYLTGIHVINAVTHEIYPVTSYIDVAMRETTAINVAGIIYLFGGVYNNGVGLSSWRSIEPRTFSPTSAPSNTPSQAPTSAPSKAPTVHVNETRPDDTTKTDSQLVIFGYESDASASVALTFPEIDFLTFREVYQDTCNWELDVLSSEDYELYLVSVDTIYTSIDEICIRFNNKDIVLQPDKSELSNNSVGLYEWTAEESSDTAPSCSEDKYRMSIKGIDRGSYCFAAYQLKGSAGVVGLDETKYKFRLQKRFIWTDTFVHILNTNFENNIATHGAGGAIAIVSEDGIDEFFSAQISYSNFTENYAMLGGGAIYREYSYAEIANYRSAYMSVLELTSVNINESVVVINEGGSIKTDLASKVKSQGLYFKYVLSITDSIIGHSTTAGDEINTKEIELLRRRNRIRRRRMQSNVDENPGDPDDGYGGVLHFEYSNVYLAYSIIEFGRAYQGGGIYLFDTVFQSFHSDILDNKASSDGGGLYQSLYSKYSKYDLCVSIYQTFFDNNIAGRFGGAIYSKLHGKEIGNTRVENRESCFKIINGTFINNGNISVYVNVTSGQHKVLRNQGALSTFCPDTSECTDFKSVLQYLCVTQIPEHCEKDFNPTDDDSINPLTVIKDIPGASVILYIYGWDAFGNRMLNTEFGLLASASGAQVINPGGTQSTANKNQYIVPLVVSTGSKDTFAQIIVEDIGGRADPIKITLQITDCDPGFHQNKITKDSDLFECNYCPVDKYTMGTSPCKNCPNGMECSGGNNVYVKENWYGKVGVGTCWTSNTENCAGKVEPGTCWADDNYDPDNSYITTTLCPPGYCCSVAKCTFPTLFNYTWDDDQNDPNFYKCYNESNTDNNNSTRRRRFAEDIDTDTDTDTDTNNDTHDIKHKKNTKSHNGKYKCKICEKTFSASYFKIHQRVHTKEKPFQCNQCSKAFRQKCHLNNHITQIHAKNGKYLCKYCSKRFCKPSQLKRHTRTHTNERPFKCDKCNKAFALKCNLKHHTRTHTKEKPFKCSQCNRAFALKCNLKRHKKRHQKKHKR